MGQPGSTLSLSRALNAKEEFAGDEDSVGGASIGVAANFVATAATLTANALNSINRAVNYVRRETQETIDSATCWKAPFKA